MNKNHKVRPQRPYFAAVKNRVMVPLRLNITDQQNMNSLMEFYNLSDRDVAKLAFEQLVTATNSLQQKLKLAEEQDEVQSNESSGGNSADSDGPVGASPERDPGNAPSSSPGAEQSVAGDAAAVDKAS